MKPQIGIFDWVEASSALPPKDVYEGKFQLAAAADRHRFHAYFVAEHQGTPLSIDGSPSVLLAAMAQRTGRLRLGPLTFCLPWYNPYRLYNEVCMLDQLSGGRLELGVGRGVSPIESAIFGMKSIEESRERYREALDIFFQASRNDVLNYRGKYHEYRDVELHVKPVQKPYPPLWFPSSNRESIEFTARHGYHTAFLGKRADSKPLFERYLELWEKHRHDAGRHNAHVERPFLAKTQHLVIAERQDEAERLGLEAYGRWAAHIHHLTRKLGRPDVHKTEPYAPDSAQPLIAGTPAAVREKLEAMLEQTGANYLLCIFSFGELAPEHALRSLELFSTEIMPCLKKDDKK
jgi:alkanesulfonate monooxygenase SsuD/methylene tetrahydromethanopterin reductase-like flavin-dependent oxidoreductase (luciferase family)